MKKLLLSLCLALAVTPAFASVLIGDLYYNLNDADKTAEVTYQIRYSSSNYSDLSGDLNIPTSVEYNDETYTVTSIGEAAFYYSSYCSDSTGSLSIPETVTSIGHSAFRNCSGLIGTLTIPDAVTFINGFAFYGCSGFNGSLTIPDAVTSIGESAFSGCKGFNGVLTIPEAVTSIGNSTFYGCSGFTGTLTIPEVVTSIGNSAFSNCSGFTGTLTIPEAVTSIGNSAFSGCSGFNGSLTIPDAVTSIGNSTFSGCSGFTGSLTIPDAVTSIGNSAFYNCKGFTSLTVGKAVTSIRTYAFQNCSGLTEIDLGEALEKIGESNGSVFSGCSKIERVTCRAVNPPVFYGSGNFPSSVLQNAWLAVPAEGAAMYALAEVWKDFVNRDEVRDPIEPVFESLYMGLGETLDLTRYLTVPTEGSVVLSDNATVAAVKGANTVEALQFGHATVTYTLLGARMATFDIYVCPTLTVEHGEGAVYTHYVLHNTRPTVHLEPAFGYSIGGVTHDGEDVTEAVIDANGRYTLLNPVTANTVINLAMFDNGDAGLGAAPAGATDIRVLVDGHDVRVVGEVEADEISLYTTSGILLSKPGTKEFTVESRGLFLVKAGDSVFKIIIR